MAPNTITTLGTTETFRFLPGGKPEAIIRTRWMWGENHGPYTTDIPKADFTAARLAQEQQKVVAELQQLR